MRIYIVMKKNKCGFQLAEEQMKRKTFFSHTAGSLGSCVRGCLGHMVCARYSFVCCHLPLPDLAVHLPLFKCFSSSFEVVMYLYLLILLVSFTLSQFLAKL